MRGLNETPNENSGALTAVWLGVRRLPRSFFHRPFQSARPPAERASERRSTARRGSAGAETSGAEPSAITVVVADEENERRASCVRVLAPEPGIRVVAEAGTAEETLRSARLVPRILLVDASLVLREGFALLPTFRRWSPGTRVIVLTGRSSGVSLLPALALGADGYLNRRLMRPLLPKAVRKVDGGEPWISRKLLPRVIESLMRLGATARSRA